MKIAHDWNVPASRSSFVTGVEVRQSFVDRYPVHEAGGRAHLEYWIPAEDLYAFSEAILRQIEVVAGSVDVGSDGESACGTELTIRCCQLVGL